MQTGTCTRYTFNTRSGGRTTERARSRVIDGYIERIRYDGRRSEHLPNCARTLALVNATLVYQVVYILLLVESTWAAADCGLLSNTWLAESGEYLTQASTSRPAPRAADTGDRNQTDQLPTGHDDAVVNALSTGLVGTEIVSRYQLQSKTDFKMTSG